MPTTKKRRMLSLPDGLDIALTHLAQRDELPVSTKAVHLLQLAIEIDEDAVWEKWAAERDAKNVRFISHEKAWS